jgi:sigma-E factor negative regulatory protein RseC
MLEETGIVVGIEDDLIVVETAPRSACSGCGAGGCSTSVIARLFGARRARLRMANTLHAAPGQAVVIGIPDQVLVRVSVMAYLLPLLAMILGASCAAALGLGEVTQALLAVIGLLLGLAGVGAASDSERARARYAPRLLRLADPVVRQVQLMDMQRSTR